MECASARKNLESTSRAFARLDAARLEFERAYAFGQVATAFRIATSARRLSFDRRIASPFHVIAADAADTRVPDRPTISAEIAYRLESGEFFDASRAAHAAVVR